MNETARWTDQEKKQLKIFVIINFGTTILMGLLMGVSYRMGNDVTAFPSAQMMYPAAGVILALILTLKGQKKLPMKFFITYLVTAVITVLLTILGVIVPGAVWYLIENYVFMAGSILSWIMLLCEKKDVRDSFGLRFGGHGTGKSLLMMLLFLVLYILRLVLASLTDGSTGNVLAVFADPSAWVMMAVVVINFYLSFIIFFGEEYGWRFFLQPLLQKRFGLKGGVILLGVIWGLWHLPINVFYYSPDTWLQSIMIHQITCITFSIFFGYAYGKTGNMWVPIVIHYINNNMAVVITQSTDLGNQVYRWEDVLLLLLINGVLFVPFLFTKVYKKPEKREISAVE